MTKTKQTEQQENSRNKSAGRTARSGAVKVSFVLLLVIFLFVVYKNVDAEDVSLDVVRERLKAETDLSSMTECDGRALRQFIGIDPSEYADFIYYKGSEALSVDELLIIRVDDKETLDGLLDRVEKRISSQRNAFESYGPEQVRRLNDAVYIKKGNFLFYCVADDTGAYEEVFRDVV